MSQISERVLAESNQIFHIKNIYKRRTIFSIHSSSANSSKIGYNEASLRSEIHLFAEKTDYDYNDYYHDDDYDAPFSVDRFGVHIRNLRR